MVKRIFYFINFIMAIATLVVIVLAIMNSINSLSFFSSNKSSAMGFEIVPPQTFRSDTGVNVSIKELPSEPKIYILLTK